MTQDASGEYLRSAVMTATPEQLHLMLYDGAIRFSRQAREALARGDFGASCEGLLKAQRIVLELQKGLRPEVNPALCEQMSSLYTFIYNRLIDANLKRRQAPIDEALQVLEHQRDTWRLLMDRTRDATAGSDADATGPTSSVGRGLSVEG